MESRTALNKIVVPDYHPPIWARNSHFNTIVANNLPSPKLIAKQEKCILSFQDGNRTSVFIEDHQSEWVVVLFHGLAGSAHSDFLIRAANACHRMKISSVAVNHRNAGDASGLSTKPYHSGRGEDISDVCLWVKEKFPQRKILTLGYSMSGSMILNLRTGRSGTIQPDWAVVINPPLFLADSSRKMTKGFTQVYGQHFVNDLRRQVDELIKKGVVDSRYRIPKGITIWEFDDHFTAPLCGFSSAEDYYQKASVGPYLENILGPTLLVAATDDPFIDFGHLDRVNAPDFLKIHKMKYGGHLGFLMGPKSKWTDLFLDRILRSLSAK